MFAYLIFINMHLSNDWKALESTPILQKMHCSVKRFNRPLHQGARFLLHFPRSFRRQSQKGSFHFLLSYHSKSQIDIRVFHDHAFRKIHARCDSIFSMWIWYRSIRAYFYVLTNKKILFKFFRVVDCDTLLVIQAKCILRKGLFLSQFLVLHWIGLQIVNVLHLLTVTLNFQETFCLPHRKLDTWLVSLFIELTR